MYLCTPFTLLPLASARACVLAQHHAASCVRARVYLCTPFTLLPLASARACLCAHPARYALHNTASCVCVRVFACADLAHCAEGHPSNSGAPHRRGSGSGSHALSAGGEHPKLVPLLSEALGSETPIESGQQPPQQLGSARSSCSGRAERAGRGGVGCRSVGSGAMSGGGSGSPARTASQGLGQGLLGLLGVGSRPARTSSGSNGSGGAAGLHADQQLPQLLPGRRSSSLPALPDAATPLSAAAAASRAEATSDAAAPCASCVERSPGKQGMSPPPEWGYFPAQPAPLRPICTSPGTPAPAPGTLSGSRRCKTEDGHSRSGGKVGWALWWGPAEKAVRLELHGGAGLSCVHN